VQVTVGGHSAELQLRQEQGPGPGRLRYIRDGVERNAIAVRDAQALHLAVDGHSFVFFEVSATPGAAAPNDAGRACASVAGKVTQILVAAGDVVQPGQHLVCVEAMKMEMWLSAEAAGTVTAVHAQMGAQVESGTLLVEIALEPNKD
jgi:geranyl-CoA carboxylase alpha subunit